MTGGDDVFCEPYVDVEEERTAPVGHRFVHGGFRGTQTRFSFYFPPEEQYDDRFVTVVEGGQGGHENRAAKLRTHAFPSIEWAASAGAFLVESNGGHVAGQSLPTRGAAQDDTVTAYRATAAATRFAREYAVGVYGRRPSHGYIVGGSGGGRALLGLENTTDLWDGAVQFINAAGQGVSLPTVLARATHVLRDDIDAVVTPLEPGGSGDPFGHLSSAQRAALEALYRAGFQRGGEFQLRDPGPEFAIVRLFMSLLAEHDPSYYDDFWRVRGYPGHDGRVDGEIVQETRRVERVVRLGDLTPEEQRRLRELLWRVELDDPSRVVGVVVADPHSGARGSDIAGRGDAGPPLFCAGVLGDLLVVDDPPLSRLASLRPGSELLIDNHRFLAFCYSYLHQVEPGLPVSAHLAVAGLPVHPQRSKALQDILVGVRMTGAYDGKLIYVGSVNDSMSTPIGWPVGHAARIRARLGSRTADRLRVWLTENATHIQASERPPGPVPVVTARLVDWIGVVEQAVRDLVDWVERDVPPPQDTAFEVRDGQLFLPGDAADRGGVQPVVRVTADGHAAVSVAAGDPVRLAVSAAVPPGTGVVVGIEWDLYGTGEWPSAERLTDAAAGEVRREVVHAYERPGTYFPAARVTAHRDGLANHATARSSTWLVRASTSSEQHSRATAEAGSGAGSGSGEHARQRRGCRADAGWSAVEHSLRCRFVELVIGQPEPAAEERARADAGSVGPGDVELQLHERIDLRGQRSGHGPAEPVEVRLEQTRPAGSEEVHMGRDLAGEVEVPLADRAQFLRGEAVGGEVEGKVQEPLIPGPAAGKAPRHVQRLVGPGRELVTGSHPGPVDPAWSAVQERQLEHLEDRPLARSQAPAMGDLVRDSEVVTHDHVEVEEPKGSMQRESPALVRGAVEGLDAVALHHARLVVEPELVGVQHAAVRSGVGVAEGANLRVAELVCVEQIEAARRIHSDLTVEAGAARSHHCLPSARYAVVATLGPTSESCQRGQGGVGGRPGEEGLA
ncbi:MAG: hypothetical protein JWO98_5455, partial [Frankiales bacterium]|nr:hypothetical protein [Frankiales bacterium]